MVDTRFKRTCESHSDGGSLPSAWWCLLSTIPYALGSSFVERDFPTTTHTRLMLIQVDSLRLGPT